MQLEAVPSPKFNMTTSEHPMKKVAVIGAGLSGLVTIRELLQDSHSVVCFEQENHVGGAFNPRKSQEYGAYDDLHLTISNYFMSFSSFPPKDPKRRYWTAAEYANYLNEFAEAFSLTDYVRFRTTVIKVEPVDAETWRVTYQTDGVISEECFDAVAICSGKFRQPKIPNFPGLSSFKGKVHHSFDYKSPEQFKGKDVVCVGAGESGSDVVHQIAKTSRTAHLVVNRPKHIIPRMIFGDTNDSRTTRASHYSYLVTQSNLEATIKKRIFDRKLVKDTAIDSFSVWKYLVKYGFHGEFSNKNDSFFQDIDFGRLKLHLFGVDHVYEDGVVLKDGTRIRCSDIVLSTGYSTQFDLINHPAAKQVAENLRNNLFHMIHPDLRESMAWIGYVRPDVGGVPAVAELQARYFSKLLARKLRLPKRDVLEQEIDQLRAAEEFHFCLEPDHSENVKYYHVTSQLAEKLGAKARWYHLISDPRLLLCYYHGSMLASQYRLVGPDSNRRQAKEFIKRAGLTKAPIKHVAFVVGVTSLLSAAAPIYRRAFKWLGLEDRSAHDLRKFGTIREILARQWPARRHGAFARGSTLRSLFEREYEYEGFKFFLVERYSIAPSTFKGDSATVAELDELLKKKPVASGPAREVASSNA